MFTKSCFAVMGICASMQLLYYLHMSWSYVIICYCSYEF